MSALEDPPTPSARFVLASDVGGTFTDTVLVDRWTGATWSTKVPSRNRRQEEAVQAGLQATVKAWRKGNDGEASLGRPSFHHGTTVATNTLLERRGASVAVVTNEGFEDLLHVRRQDRLDLYDMEVARPPPLVPADLRFGVPVRRGPHGEAWGPPDADLPARCAAIAAQCGARQVEAVAVCFLHADLFPEDERRVGDLLRAALPGVPVVESHAVWPEMREVERFETATANAHLMPVMAPYVARLLGAADEGLAKVGGVGPVRVLDSAGTLQAPEMLAHLPASLLLSGPAGGVRAATSLAAHLGVDPIVTFDVGGTSTDVALVVDGAPRLSHESRVGGLACRFPAVEIHTLGAGGGSVIWQDHGGLLQVGPRSQRAYPGPACYGRGGELPTLTDVLLLAGRVPDGIVFGARTRPDRKAAFRAMERLAGAVRLPVEDTVLGAVEIAVAVTTGGVQVVTTHQGHDPRAAHLMAYGGAGPMLAAELADALGMAGVVVPWEAGTFSARGMVSAPIVRRRAVGLAVRLASPSDMGDAAGGAADRSVRAGPTPAASAPLADSVAALADRLGESPSALRLRAGMRYAGQSHELEVTVGQSDDAVALRAAFEAEHERAFGHRHDDRAVDVVRLVGEHVVDGIDSGWSRAPDVDRQEYVSRPNGLAQETALLVRTADGFEERRAPVVWRGDVSVGQVLEGPLLVPDPTTITYVPPAWSVAVDSETRALLLTRGGST